MHESHLTNFVRRRLDALESIDKNIWPEESLEDLPRFSEQRPSLSKALKGSDLKVLVEIKKASPTMGDLSSTPATELCLRYVSGGADAISVLVDQPNFKGHPEDLKSCIDAFPEFPFLYKDFVATPYQVKCAKALGASSVLLMTQLLEASELNELYHLAREIGLEPFVETHSQEELALALELHPPLIGINSRDFKTPGLPIDLKTAGTITTALEGHWPEETTLVAQSGVSSPEDLQVVVDTCPEGLPHAVQVGSRLSQSGDMPKWLKARD